MRCFLVFVAHNNKKRASNYYFFSATNAKSLPKIPYGNSRENLLAI